MLDTAMSDYKTTKWASLLQMIQLQKNSCFYSGIGRSPLQALTGRVPSYGLEGLNLPKEVIDELETEEELLIVTDVQEEVSKEADRDVLDQVLVDTTELIVSQRLEIQDNSEVETEVESCISYGIYKHFCNTILMI